MKQLHQAARQRRAAAYSLLEVVLASSICTAALVPALAVMRDGMSAAEKIDSQHLMLLFGVSKMEEQLAMVAANWTTGSLNGDFALQGQANIRYSSTTSDSVASGGIVGRLMNVSVTVYYDDNGNDSMDAAEIRSTFTTKVSKLATYESIAGS
jgi:hypothetical protein